jgi:hypothetical protein
VGSTPTRATRGWSSRVVFLTAACKAVAFKLWGGRRKVQLLHHPLAVLDRGPFVYRQRTLAPQAGEAGSTPARTTGRLAGWRNGRRAGLRSTCPRGVGVRVSPRRLMDRCGHARFPGEAGARLAFMRPIRPARYRGLGLRVGRCSAEFHTLGGGGSTPRPATVDLDGTVR